MGGDEVSKVYGIVLTMMWCCGGESVLLACDVMFDRVQQVCLPSYHGGMTRGIREIGSLPVWTLLPAIFTSLPASSASGEVTGWLCG